jgi:glyoxylase-like metal-dependent hydrolase (beta-lactamase superfamily II)
MADYLASLDRLLERKPGTLYPAHGPVVPAGAQKLLQYKAHRLEREARVLSALTREPALPAELVPAAYPDVAKDLYPLAERSLLAHLIKLVREGRAAEKSGRYFLR